MTTNPGEAYEPAADYAIDPSGAYVTRDERGRDVVRLRKNIRLIHVGVDRPALSKAA